MEARRLGFIPHEQFLAAVQRPYKRDEPIEARGIRGRVIEPISHDEYLEAWSLRGFESDAISINPRFYYRCTLEDVL